MKTECHDPDQFVNGALRAMRGPHFRLWFRNASKPSWTTPMEEVIEAKVVQFSTGRFCPDFDRP